MGALIVLLMNVHGALIVLLNVHGDHFVGISWI